MKLIPLSQGLFAQVDDHRFEELNKYKWHAHKSGTGKSYYAVRNIRIEKNKRTAVLMHRQVLGLVDPKVFCDHKNINGLDNQECNLRVANHSQNAMNRTGVGSSKYKGVHKYRKRWIAQINVNGKKKHIGVYDTEELAARSYNDVAKKEHGEFAYLNIIENVAA